MTAGRIFDPEDLSTCISCGFCLPSCPAYELTGDEASSPRGRIALMRAIDDGTVDVFDAAARDQGSFCLGCRACEPVCPAGVPYGRLLESLRDAQWSGRRRPLRIRPLLTFARSHRLIRLAGRLRRHARFTPSRSSPDEGHTLTLGCFERVLFPAVSRAAAGTLPGVRVPRDQGCCGALHAHNGDSARGERLATDLASRPGRIVSTAADCCGAAGAYAILSRRDSRRVLAAKLAVLADLGLDFLVVVNPGCLRQLTTAVRRARLRTKVVHLAELVAAAQADRR
jgi:glycolate oxidase iron-sulfur subunit